MRLPKSIRIGKSRYCIHVLRELDERYAGLCYPEDKVILISASQTRKQAMVSLWHEILHAIEEECGVKLGHAKINRMEMALAEVFEQLQKKC